MKLPEMYSSPQILRIAALPLALLLSGAIVWGGSFAAFNDNATNPNNAWTTGVVALTDDAGGAGGSSGTALLNAKKVSPGFEASRCITVLSDATVPTRLRMYGSGSYETEADTYLFPALMVTVSEGTSSAINASPPYADPFCTGFTAESTIYDGSLSELPIVCSNGCSADENGYSLPANGQRAYRIVIALPSTVSDRSLAGLTVGGNFTWEARSGT